MGSVARRLGGFALAGFTGFAVDAGLTEGLAGFGVSPYLGRVFAVAVAIAVTYTINRNLTWRERRASVPGRRTRYVAVSLVSIATNYLIFAAALAALPGLRPVIAVAAGTAVGMVMNFVGYSRLVFKDNQAA
ncbi:GtrA family protein [Pleomorphomonas oryzae]|uniref:GtrA family protein n=1 Tax=Pleomorphomonas oryzae TaxID=261934 RepID=UPI0004242A40|nr:GtrA family protein [Pleomorphomonas oryzae]